MSVASTHGRLTAQQLESAELDSYPAADPPSYSRARQEEEEEVQRLSAPERRLRQDQLAELKAMKVSELKGGVVWKRGMSYATAPPLFQLRGRGA